MSILYRKNQLYKLELGLESIPLALLFAIIILKSMMGGWP